MTRRGKRCQSASWAARQNRDPYVRRARAQGRRARSAFKLEQISRKCRLLRPDCRILDLGCAPGGWCQHAAAQVKSPDQVLGVDRLPMQSIAGVQFVQGDFLSGAVRQRILAFFQQRKADLVLSDMAPDISGIRSKDQAAAETLQHGILELCAEVLKPGGKLLTKLFAGETMSALRQAYALNFEQIQMIKPEASRPQSREVYLLGRGFKGRRSALQCK